MSKDKITVRETIRHGDYNNRREVTIEPTWNGFLGLLASSPYPKTGDLADNEYVAKAFAELLANGKSEYGWADFEII